MACNAERLMNLPIQPEYKQALIKFCGSPDNQQSCQVLCDASDEEIVQTVQQAEGQLKDWQENGPPEGLMEGLQQGTEQGAEQGPPPPQQQPAGGIGSLPEASGPQQQIPPGIAPSELSQVPMPMDTPQQYAGGGMVRNYGLGGWLGDNLGAIIGGVIGFATMGPMGAGWMSGAMAAGVGSAAGSYAQHQDTRRAIGSGIAGAALGWGATQMGVGAAPTTASTTAPTVAGPMTPGANQLGVVTDAGALPNAGKIMNAAYTPTGLESSNIHAMSNAAANTGSGGLTAAEQADALAKMQSGVGGASTAGETSALAQFGKEWGPTIGAGIGIAGLLEDEEQITAEQGRSAYAEYQACRASGRTDCKPPDDLFPSNRDHLNLGRSRPQPRGIASLSNHGGNVSGPGTGTSDSIPANLSDGEFVMTDAAVRGAGGGDPERGAEKMYWLMDQLENRGRA